MALLLTSVFGVTGCGSDDGEAPVESRIKNSGYDERVENPAIGLLPEEDKLRYHREDIDEDMNGGINEEDQRYANNADYLDDIGPSEQLDDDYIKDDDIHDGPDRDIKLKIPYELGENDIREDIDDDINDYINDYINDMDYIKDDESSIKCSHSTARISPNDSYKSLSKSFCE